MHLLETFQQCWVPSETLSHFFYIRKTLLRFISKFTYELTEDSQWRQSNIASFSTVTCMVSSYARDRMQKNLSSSKCHLARRNKKTNRIASWCHCCPPCCPRELTVTVSKVYLKSTYIGCSRCRHCPLRKRKCPFPDRTAVRDIRTVPHNSCHDDRVDTLQTAK